jgi:cytochrome c oxidase cbb3-type subunit 3
LKLIKQSRLMVLPVLVSIFAAVAALSSQEQTASPAANEPGRQVFAKNCSGCHGLDGKGTQRAPNIAAGSRASQLTERDLLRIVAKGIPDRGMPGFDGLGSDQLHAVVEYLRMPNSARAGLPLPGAPERGKELFFGEARCSQCHTVQGSGGFIAPDLSSYARGATPEDLRTAITKPEDHAGPTQLASVTTTGGQRYEGMIRNEDNFSLQMQSLNGTFHFFRKTELKTIERKPASTMHRGFESRFSGSQLDDLISYLIRASDSTGNKSRTRTGNQETDEHQ